MKKFYKYALISLFLTSQHIFSEPVNTPSKNDIDVKAFPDNNISYFFNNNNAESWRLVYGKFGNPPDDPNNVNHCNTNETNPDKALSFNISDIIKNAGGNFNVDNIHVYYDGDSGKKALALRLNDPKIKNSLIAMAEVLIRKENSKYTKLTPDRLLKKLTLLNSNEKNIMYVCFGYLQQLAITSIKETKDDIAINSIVDPQKIVFWYDGSKATPIPPVNSKSDLKTNKRK